MMKKNTYISYKHIWSIVKAFEFDNLDADIGLLRLLKVLQSAHGTFCLQNNEILFIGNYDYLDRKWSTSIIGSDELHTEKEKQLLDRINEEKACVKWFLTHINDSFKMYPSLFLSIFYERYFLNLPVKTIKSKHQISNKYYYSSMEAAEYLAKTGWLLWKAPPGLYEAGGWDDD